MELIHTDRKSFHQQCIEDEAPIFIKKEIYPDDEYTQLIRDLLNNSECSIDFETRYLQQDEDVDVIQHVDG